jgi:hypothetical protein
LGRLHLKTGSQNFKRAAAKPDVPVSQLLHTPHISRMPTAALTMLAIGLRPVSALAASDVYKEYGRCQSSTRSKEQKVERRCQDFETQTASYSISIVFKLLLHRFLFVNNQYELATFSSPPYVVLASIDETLIVFCDPCLFDVRFQLVKNGHVIECTDGWTQIVGCLFSQQLSYGRKQACCKG